MSFRLGYRMLEVIWPYREVDGPMLPVCFFVFPACCSCKLLPLGGKIFQNRKVSSPAPVTRVYPSGLAARYNTLYVWPVSVAIRFMLG